VCVGVCVGVGVRVDVCYSLAVAPFLLCQSKNMYSIIRFSLVNFRKNRFLLRLWHYLLIATTSGAIVATLTLLETVLQQHPGFADISKTEKNGQHFCNASVFKKPGLVYS